jgi:hypothetical protein
MMLISMNSHLGLKNGVSNVIEDLRGKGVAMLLFSTIFLK